ncbi:MAG TPA: hypothetical protein VNO79_15985, partial [Actinomycetota bacterium]|nr:hypothetical protein [Actinomycetota bacterium]
MSGDLDDLLGPACRCAHGEDRHHGVAGCLEEGCGCPCYEPTAGSPHPSRVELADLPGVLDEIEAFITRYVHFADRRQVVPLVLFVPVCYAVLDDPACIPAAPYLSVTSPAPECGKTRVLEALHKLLGDERALFVAGSMTPATLYRSREERPIALLVDEVGRLFGRRDDAAKELGAILDSGYRRGATVPRAVPVGKTFVVKRWPVFGPAVLAGLGELADTTKGRCIPLLLQRRPRGARVDPFYEDEAEPAAARVRDRL